MKYTIQWLSKGKWIPQRGWWDSEEAAIDAALQLVHEHGHGNWRIRRIA